MRIDTALIQPKIMKAGEPQGSVLDLLYLLYTHNFPTGLLHDSYFRRLYSHPSSK